MYERILDKPIELQIVNVEGTNVPIPPKSTSNRILMPNAIPTIAMTERDLYVLMERELSKHIGKYDRNNAIAFGKQYPDYPQMAYIIYNIVENHRCESYLAELFKGSGFQLKDIMRRFVQREPKNLVEVLLAVAYRRMDAIPKELEQEANEFDNLLRNVENCSAEASHVIGKKVMQVIQDTLAKEPQQPDEMLPGVANPLAPTNPFSHTKQHSSVGEDEEETPEEEETEEEQEQETEEDKQGEPDADETGEPSTTPEEVKQEIEQMVKDFKDFAGAEGTKLEQPEEIETESVEIPEDKTEEELLEQAEEKGAGDIEELKEQLEKALSEFDYTQIEKKEKDDGDYTLTYRGTHQKVVFNDPYDTLREPRTEYDKATARHLSDVFKRIKGKVDFVRSNRGNKVVIKAYIQRRAGSANNKIFKRRQEERGLAIAYCIDISSSMNDSFPRGGASGKWTRKNVSMKKKIAKANNTQAPITSNNNHINKLNAVRYILLTLHEATRKLENVQNFMYAFADEYTDEIPIPKLTRQRLTTIHGGGGTATHGAVRAATEELKKHATYKKLLVIITDGAPNNQEATTAEIQRAREAGVNVYSIIVERMPANAEYMQYYINRFASIFGEPNKQFSILTSMADMRRVMTRMVAKNVIDMLYANH